MSFRSELSVVFRFSVFLFVTDGDKQKPENFLAHMMPLVFFHGLWKHQETSIFLVFSEGSYRDNCHDMCQQKNRIQLTVEIAILKIIYDRHEIINFPENWRSGRHMIASLMYIHSHYIQVLCKSQGLRICNLPFQTLHFLYCRTNFSSDRM